MFVLFMLALTGANAQENVVTIFDPLEFVKSKSQPCSAALYKVELKGQLTYVTIKLVPTCNWKYLIYYTSPETYVISGDAKLPLLGALGKNGTFHSCTYNDGWGWNKVKKGHSYFYTLVFSGRIPGGRTTFSLVDEAISGRGFGFQNYRINNPPYTIKDENFCKENIDKNNDGICGIYEEIGGSLSKIACIKIDNEYELIYFGEKNTVSWWFPGDLKAKLEVSSTPGIFKATWVNRDKTIDPNAYILSDGPFFKCYTIAKPHEFTFLKMYPKYSESFIGKEKCSGTGFALKDGYLVTNHHVIDGAKTITIQGVNGDYTHTYSAKVIASDKNNDLALLRIDDSLFSGFDSLPYGIKTSTSEVGEEISVLGYPLIPTMGSEIKLTTGVISSKTGFQGDISCYQISAPVQPGNSGGPVFDSKGNLIGIIRSKHLDADNVGYAIKTSYLKLLVDSCAPDTIMPISDNTYPLSLPENVKRIKNFVFIINCSK